MSNSVLHYILGCADRNSKAEFDRILATPGATPDLKNLLKATDPKEIQKVMDLIQKRRKKFEGTPAQRKLYDLLLKKNGVLDMSPGELERVLQIPRDPLKQAKFEIHLLEYFRPDNLPSAEHVTLAVAKMKEEHELDIEELKYNPDTTRLDYAGDKDVAKKLLEQIGFKDATKVLDRELWYAKQKGNRRLETDSFLKFAIPEDRFGSREPFELRGKLQDWLEQEGLNENTATLSDQEKAILFTGKVADLKNLIYNFRLEPTVQADLLRSLGSFLVK